MLLSSVMNYPGNLETQRLLLRPPEYRDVGDIYEYMSDPEVMRYRACGVLSRPAVLVHGFQHAGVEKVGAAVNPNKKPSIRVLHRYGFTYSRKFHWPNQSLVDFYILPHP
jgi:RimJ/RimL family protein N-acetyltransferase